MHKNHKIFGLEMAVQIYCWDNTFEFGRVLKNSPQNLCWEAPFLDGFLIGEASEVLEAE